MEEGTEWAELGVGAVVLQEYGMGDGPPAIGLGVLRSSPLVDLLNEGGCCDGMFDGCELAGCRGLWWPIFVGTGDILGDSRGEFLKS